MKTLIFTLLCTLTIALCCFSGNANAQNIPGASGSGKKIFVDGNASFNFGNGFSTISVSPIVGYWIMPRLGVGAGPSFSYTKYSGASYNSFGARAMARYYPLDFLFAHAEFEYVSYKFSGNEDRQSGVRLPLGLGYNQRLTGNTYAYFMALYDVLYGTNSPFYVPGNNGLIFRGGVTLGF